MRIRMNLVKGAATSIAFLILLLLSPVSSLDRATARSREDTGARASKIKSVMEVAATLTRPILARTRGSPLPR